MSERILILDDESSILEILGQHLSEEGHTCEVTTSPVEAIERLREGRFTLLLTDIKMPEMSGIEVVRQAKEIDPDLAIVAVSAMHDIGSAIEAMRGGADDYILKPFNLSEISLSVVKAVEKRNLIFQNREYQQDLETRVQTATEDLEHTNHELRATKQYLESLLHSTVDAIITINERGAIEFVNQGVLRMLGYTHEALIGTPCATLLMGGAEEIHHVGRLLKENNPLQNYETELRHNNGTHIPVNMSLSQVTNPDTAAVTTLAICKDITEQKRLESELKEMSIKDSLTGLYNQRYFYDRLEGEIERARRQNHPLSLVLFDLDQFKAYNDCHGHLAGDRVLKEVGVVVNECTREHVDIGFRYGGDEFTVILPEADEEQARQIAERIRTSFEARRFDTLTLSMGLMSYHTGYSIKNFVQFADAMMYDAKRSGGNRVFIYKPETVEGASPKPT